MNNTDLLARVPLLAALGPSEREAMEASLGVRDLGPGEAIFARGDPADVLYLVVSGQVEIFLPPAHGAPRLALRRLGPGGHFGELALLHDTPRSASAVALIPTRLLTLTRAAFLDPVLASPAGARVLIDELAGELTATTALLSERASRNVQRELDAARTPADRLAERVAAWNGSWWFLTFLLVLCGGWWAWNTRGVEAFDPYPFAFFNLVLAVLVVLQGPLLMMAQNREARAERAAAEADYRVNLKNEVALERLGHGLEEVRREVAALRSPAPPA